MTECRQINNGVALMSRAGKGWGVIVLLKGLQTQCHEALEKGIRAWFEL